METRTLTCINCPMGCQLKVELENGEVKSVSGYTCRRGEIYARKEVTNPTRIVTSSVRAEGALSGETMVSVKTASDIPKGKIFDVVRDLKDVMVKAPVHIGDVVKANVAGTGVDMVATRTVI